jgi:CheY-like chemotaxis protein
VEVADTGPGIQAAHRDKLFQTFERLNAEQASSVEGQGLGLAIAARLVEKMGGQIGYGDNPGGGSVFWLELPLPAGGSSTAPVVAPSFVPAPGARPLRVLVADDEDLNRVIATKFLKTVGHEVTSVDGGAAAVEAATTGDFDVILMDVRMPGMNGMEATRLIRVVAVTAHAFAQQIEMCRQAGMDAHVSKPFKLAMLLSVLEDPTKPSSRPAPAFVSPVTVAAEPEPDAPIFDRSMFDDVVDSLSAVEARGHLQTLIARSETLLRELRRTAMLGHAAELIGDAHKLAGSAGICGFLAIAAAAKQFEVTAEADGPVTETIALRFGNVIEASLPIMRREQQAIADSVA